MPQSIFHGVGLRRTNKQTEQNLYDQAEQDVAVKLRFPGDRCPTAFIKKDTLTARAQNCNLCNKVAAAHATLLWRTQSLYIHNNFFLTFILLNYNIIYFVSESDKLYQ